MQRPRPEGKDDAARSRSKDSTPQVDVIVLTVDPALLATLREASELHHRLFHAESAEAVVDLLVGGRCGLLIVDVAVVRGDVADLIDRLQTQFPEVLILATGRREQQRAVAALVASGRVYRFLHKPISPARAQLFLSAATRRYGELHPHDARSRLAMTALATRRTRAMIIGAAAAAIVLALSLASWIAQRDGQRIEPLQATQSDTYPTLTEVLARADAARDSGQLLPPATDNALDLYRAALQADATNAHATREIERIGAKLERDMNDALAARDAPRARVAFTQLQQAAPRHARLDELQSALLALARQLPTPKPAPSTARAPELPSAASPPKNFHVETARAFLQANQWVEPPEASALGSLRRAREVGEDADSIQIVATDLGMRFSARATEALDAQDLAGAKAAYESAHAVDLEFATALPGLEQVAERLAQVERAARQTSVDATLERAAQLRQSGQLIDPPGDNAVDALLAVLTLDPASEPVREERQRLSSALHEQTRTTLAVGDIDRADVLATRAEQVLAGLPQTKALREQIGAARAQREEATTVLQATSLPRTRQVTAIYPREALVNAIEGWVDLEFTVAADGVPADITVKASEPRRVFDGAAIQALRQWRFEPIVSNGEARPRRALLRMEFRLKG